VLVSEMQHGLFVLDISLALATAHSAAVVRNTLSVWPDPAMDEAHIGIPRDMRGGGTLDVFDGTGRMVLTRAFGSRGTANIALDTHNFVPGMYVVRLSDAHTSCSARLMKITDR